MIQFLRRHRFIFCGCSVRGHGGEGDVEDAAAPFCGLPVCVRMPFTELGNLGEEQSVREGNGCCRGMSRLRFFLSIEVKVLNGHYYSLEFLATARDFFFFFFWSEHINFICSLGEDETS